MTAAVLSRSGTNRYRLQVTIDDVARVRNLVDARPDIVVDLPGTDRVLAADLDGDPEGNPVVLVHGTPDSRLARHPDPTIATGLGARLIAVDRPGFGHASFDAGTTPTGFAADVTVVLDELGIDSAHLLAWSAGAIWALGAAHAAPDRFRTVTIVGGLVPFEAFADPEVRAAAGPARLGMVETAEELGPDVAAELIAPMLVPDPATPEAALEHRAIGGDHALSTVSGADVQMAAACCDAVRRGPAGLIRDVTVQLGDSGLPFGDIAVPTRFVTGAEDTTCPPAFARWYAAHIPDARVDVVAGGSHGLLLTHWAAILERIVSSSTALMP